MNSIRPWSPARALASGLIRHPVLLIVAGAAITLLGPLADAQAQTTGSTGTRTGFGTSEGTTGSSGSTGTTGTGSPGSTSDSSSAASDTSITTTGTESQIGSTQGRFQNATAGGRFAQGTTGTTTTGTTGRNTSGRGQTTRSFGQGGLGSPFGQNGFRQGFGTGTTQTVRPTLSLGFVPQLRPANVIGGTIVQRFQTLTARAGRLADTRPDFAGVTFTMPSPGEAVLQGTVPSDAARRLAGHLARMEPGVRTVRNELTVAASPAATERATP